MPKLYVAVGKAGEKRSKKKGTGEVKITPLRGKILAAPSMPKLKNKLHSFPVSRWEVATIDVKLNMTNVIQLMENPTRIAKIAGEESVLDIRQMEVTEGGRCREV